MNFENGNPRLRRGFTTFALMLTLGLSAIGLTQCTMMENTVTGVDVVSGAGFNSRSSCEHRCNDNFKDGRRQEEKRHRAAMAACRNDRQCKKNEESLHQANMKRLEQEKKACKRSCYNEGSGTAGR